MVHFHDVDSSEMAFKIAGSLAFKDAVKKAGAVVLEPMMKVEVVCPEDFMGTVIGDLSSRRGKVQGTELEVNYKVYSVKFLCQKCLDMLLMLGP